MRNRFDGDITTDMDGMVRYDMDSDLIRDNPVRTRWEWPYSYDPFTVWGRPSPKANGSVYTDRMSQWNYDKFRELGKKVFGEGKTWFAAGCDGQKVERFLREYDGNQELQLLRVVEYCNVATGFPTWCLVYHNPKAVKNEQPG